MESKSANTNFLLAEDVESSLNDAKNNCCQVLSNSLTADKNNKNNDSNAMPIENRRKNWPRAVLLTMRKHKDGCKVDKIEIYKDNNVTPDIDSFTVELDNFESMTDNDQHVLYTEENNVGTVECVTDVTLGDLPEKNLYVMKYINSPTTVSNKNTPLEKRLNKRTLPNILKSRVARVSETVTSNISDSQSVIFNKLLLPNNISKDYSTKNIECSYDKSTVHKRKQVYNVREESSEVTPSFNAKNKKVQGKDDVLIASNIRKISKKSAGRKISQYNTRRRMRKLCKHAITGTTEDVTLAYETLMPELMEATDFTCNTTDLSFNMENDEDTLYQKNCGLCDIQQIPEPSLDSSIELPQFLDERIDDCSFSILHDVNNNNTRYFEQTTSSTLQCNAFQEYVTRKSTMVENWDNNIPFSAKKDIGCSFLSDNSCEYCTEDFTTCCEENSTFMEDSTSDISNDMDDMDFKPLEIIDTYDTPYPTNLTEQFIGKDFGSQSMTHSNVTRCTRSVKFNNDICSTCEMEEEMEQNCNLAYTNMENYQEENICSVCTIGSGNNFSDTFLQDDSSNIRVPSLPNNCLQDNCYIKDYSTITKVESADKIADNIKEVIQSEINDDSTLTASESGFELSKVDEIENENEAGNWILEVQEEMSPEEDNQTDSRKLQCTLCSLTFSNQYTLTLHQAGVHEGTFIILCEECGQIFNNKYFFDKHLIYCLHYQVPFECNICDKKYRHKSSLTFHLKNIHNIEFAHGLTKTYTCKKCSKIYSKLGAFKKHIKRHKNV